MYKLKKIVGIQNFSVHFSKISSHYKKIGYSINVLQKTACLVVNPIKIDNLAFLLNCMPVGQTSHSMMVPIKILRHIFRCEGLGLMPCLCVRPTIVKLLDFFCSGIQWYVLLSPYFYFISFLHHELYVPADLLALLCVLFSCVLSLSNMVSRSGI